MRTFVYVDGFNLYYGSVKGTPLIDLAGARSVVASIIRNIKDAGPARANAIRLIDTAGREVWRARLGSGVRAQKLR